ncbi:MAG: transcription antitermination factor NusB [Candidatus Omnitrophota bacterium]
MRKRTQSREFALQILYQMDISGDRDCDAALDSFWQRQDKEVAADVRDFTAELSRGVVANLKEIDSSIAQYASNWQIGRMAVVDRNILRLASYELIFRDDIPPKVSINEAIELAKKYSGLEAAKFVNGILDKVKAEKK